MRIAMMGTRGVPANYGGFETAIEEIGQRLAARGHEVVVYCRGRVDRNTSSHLGMDLVDLPALQRKSLETLSHSFLSAVHSTMDRPDVVFLFNAGNAPFLSVLRARNLPTIIHMDGLEWKRAKWKGFGSRYYRWAEKKCATSGNLLIADAVGIQSYLRDSYGVDSTFVPYGAPILEPEPDRLSTFKLEPDSYHLAVARFEPENNLDMIVDGYVLSRAKRPLVVVGSAPYNSSYEADVRQAARGRDVRFLGSVWDQDDLNALYGSCRSYLHGHSVGGTNPSLLRAMGCGASVSAFDVVFNREVTGGNASFFRDSLSVASCLSNDERGLFPSARGQLGREHAAVTYRWDEVTTKYEALAKQASNH